ncbi:MAG: CoA-binding protein [Desulfurococcales archaeon]|nr:CoA-binding protein [Desulfurococcales archaeon]
MEVREILERVRTIAIVGASRNPNKDAGMVPRYLKENGYRIVPINPVAEEIAGEKAYPSLSDLPGEIASIIDAVDVFRPPSEAMKIVEDASRLREKYGKPWLIWFQYGTHTVEAVEEAKKRGFIVVYDRCMMEEHRRHFKKNY